MDNPSLTKKPKIQTPDGEMVDICAPTVDYKKSTAVTETMHFVQEGEEMRLDVIANLYYGWCDKLDAILWANNIYNPFSIDATDLLIIPKVKDTNHYIKNPEKVTMPDESVQTTSSRITDAAKKLNGLTKSAKDERKSNGRKQSTNEFKPGESSKTYDGGTMYLG